MSAHWQGRTGMLQPTRGTPAGEAVTGIDGSSVRLEPESGVVIDDPSEDAIFEAMGDLDAVRDGSVSAWWAGFAGVCRVGSVCAVLAGASSFAAITD
jgi:hypothetical protein